VPANASEIRSHWIMCAAISHSRLVKREIFLTASIAKCTKLLVLTSAAEPSLIQKGRRTGARASTPCSYREALVNSENPRIPKLKGTHAGPFGSFLYPPWPSREYDFPNRKQLPYRGEAAGTAKASGAP